MTHRELYFSKVTSEGKNSPIAFAPDITDWYLENTVREKKS